MVIFPCVFSNNALSTVTNVIHFECSVQLVARMIQPRYAIHRFPRSVQLVARIIQPRYVIHDSLVACILMHDRITYGTLFNLFEHSQIRATSCTLRSTISCIKMHATIHDFVQQVARYDSGVDTNRGDLPDVARTL